jgi:hypothetical protein
MHKGLSVEERLPHSQSHEHPLELQFGRLGNAYSGSGDGNSWHGDDGDIEADLMLSAWRQGHLSATALGKTREDCESSGKGGRGPKA